MKTNGFRCPRCSGRIRITHSHPAGEAGRVSTGHCLGCYMPATVVQALVLSEMKGVSLAKHVRDSIENGNGYHIPPLKMCRD